VRGRPRRRPQRCQAQPCRWSAHSAPAAIIVGGLSGLGVARRARPSRRSESLLAQQAARSSALPGEDPSGVEASRVADSEAGSDAVPDLSALKVRPSSFKNFLQEKEDMQPLWYRLSDIYLTFLGAFLFYLEVCEPQVSQEYRLDRVEDIVNVNFLVRFVLLFWANDFKPSWFLTGTAILDLLSCLPVLGIPARFLGGAGMEKTIEIFELSRFLRLLRLSLPENTKGMGRARDALQLLVVLLSLGGTIVLSATLLFYYENPRWAVLGEVPPHPYEDCVLYMLNIFTNKDTPFFAATRSGKQVTAGATLVGAIFLPFLISGGVQVFMNPGDFGMGGLGAPITIAPEVEQGIGRAGTRSDASGTPEQWAAVLKRLDRMELASLLLPHEAQELRRRCMAKEEWLLTLDLAYGPSFSKGNDASAGQTYVLRLREWLSSAPEGWAFASPADTGKP